MKIRERYVYGDGPIPCSVMLVGQNPGKNEYIERKPFVGKSGAIVDICLQMAGIPRHTVYVTNAFKYWLGRDRHGNDIAPSDVQLEDHAPLLQNELKRVNPTYIGTIGAQATKIFLGDVTMEAVHGIPHVIDGRVILPIVHPAAGMRPGGDLLAVWSFQDFKALGALVQGKTLPLNKRWPMPDSKWVTGVDLEFTYPGADTEGDRRDPFCLSIARDARQGFVLRPKEAAKVKILGGIVLHYALHDMPVLRAMGMKLENLAIVDTMVKAYVLGEPQSLKDLTHRHLGYRMPEYKEVVREAYNKELRWWLIQALAHDWGKSEASLKLDKRGKYKLYQPQPLNGRLKRLWKDLEVERARDCRRDVGAGSLPHEDVGARRRKRPEHEGRSSSNDAGDTILQASQPVTGNGIRGTTLPAKAQKTKNRQAVNIERRLKALGDQLPRVEKKVGPLLRMSQALKLLKPSDAATYAGRDACNTVAVNQILDSRLKALGLEEVAAADCAILPMLDRMQCNGLRCDVSYLKELKKRCESVMEPIATEISRRWFGRRINLKSSDQVAELLFGKLRLRPIAYTSKGRGQTGKKTLEALKDQHECLTKIRQYRLAEANHKFTVSLPKFADEKGDIYGVFKYTRVVSGRVSMEKPTMQNIPTRTEAGREIRNAFVARPGLVFGSWDYDQIEMKVMAHLSEDPKLCKYLCQGLDIHVKTASLIFGVKDADVSKVQRTVTKNINYGLLFMIQEKGLHDQLRLVGIHEYSVDDCRNLIAEWFRIYSRVQDFREECIARARRRGFAKSMWGRPRWLPALYWNGKHVDHLRYEAERQAVSHEISSSAQDVIKRAMARVWTFLLGEWRKGTKIEPLLQIHDELLFELEPHAKKLGPQIEGLMRADSKSFRVPITTSGAFGNRWGELKG